MYGSNRKSKALEGTKIFLVDDEEMLAWSIEKELVALGAQVWRTGTLRSALSEFRSFLPDITITDLSLPDGNGLELLKKWKHEYPNMPNIIITAHAAVDSAVDAVRFGAFDYLRKPFKMTELVAALQRAAEVSKLREKVSRLQGPLKGKEKVEIIGSSKVLETMKGHLKKIANSKIDTILVEGESGAGKELAARALHYWSPIKSKPFVEINCASIPETLLESELFGFEKGAFTDARERKLGLFEMARDGTIFLDEIGEMPLKLQAKLLRVLEYRRFKRLGGVRDIEFSARIVAATNRNLADEVAERNFREDLFYRLNIVDVKVPPLREHSEDLYELVEFFLNELSKKLELAKPEISQKAIEHLKSHPFPGNIRELRNLLQKALVLYEPKILLPEHLAFSKIPTLRGKEEQRLPKEVKPSTDSNGEFLLPKKGIKLESVEKNFLEQALELSGNNQTKAAELLGVSRHTLRYRLEKYGLLDINH